jgi:ABC-type Fe3+ transport system permease subunit
VLATQEFAVYEPTGISVVATEVRMVFDTGAVSSATNSITAPMSQGEGRKSPDQAVRAAASVATTLPLLVCTLTLSLIAIWGASRGESESPTVGPWPAALDAPWWAITITLVLVILNVFVPVWALVYSLRIPFSIPSMFNEFAPEIEGAIFVACVAAVVASISAFSCAGRWTPGLMFFAGASFLIGGQLLAIALIRIYNRAWLMWAYEAFPVPVIAYVGRFGWLALAGGRATWSRSWQELRDMAAVDGAGAFRTAMSVVWPLSWPTLVAGALLVGALSMTEVPATVLLFPVNPQVLTPRLMTWLHQLRSDSMIEAALMMMMTVLFPAAAALTLISIGRKLATLRATRVRI